jgi:dihydroorotate dehydrogenase (fumarate)
MKSKGFATVDELRGLLAVPAGTDEDSYERSGYVTAVHDANSALYGPAAPTDAGNYL